MTRLFFIQVVEGDRWKALAQGQQKFFSQVEGNRGEILLEDSSLQGGYLSLATNKEWEFVYISPKEILDYQLLILNRNIHWKMPRAYL